jgi:hypothetical protein
MNFLPQAKDMPMDFRHPHTGFWLSLNNQTAK